jgi:hypothetical protein
MNPKTKITRYVAEQLGLVSDDKAVKQFRQLWWQNPRTKEKGGLRLTDQGFTCLQNADLKYHKVVFDEPIQVTNALLIWIDNNIDCPFYITQKEIYLFGEKMAVRLVLFSGSLPKMYRAQKRFEEKTKTT